MPSPFLMLALVVNGNTRPQPPVHRITALAVIAQPVPTGNRVVGMIVQGVAGFDYRSSAALGGNGVAAHGVNLGDHRDIEAGIHLRDSNRGAETGPAATDNENVVGRNVHYSASSGSAGMEPDELILATLGREIPFGRVS